LSSNLCQVWRSRDRLATCGVLARCSRFTAVSAAGLSHSCLAGSRLPDACASVPEREHGPVLSGLLPLIQLATLLQRGSSECLLAYSDSSAPTPLRFIIRRPSAVLPRVTCLAKLALPMCAKSLQSQHPSSQADCLPPTPLRSPSSPNCLGATQSRGVQ